MSDHIFKGNTMPATDDPLVSVVMVTRDVERFLAEAIESVLGQTFRDFEFVIVDFGSSDKSKDIAASYAARDSRIKLSEIPPCSYIEAKIAVCSLPKGRYIAIQDADDVSLPNRLEAEVDFMERHPEVGLLGGAVERIDSDGKYLTIADDYPTEDQEIRAGLRKWNTFWHPTVLILREAFMRVGGYREGFTQSEDYDLWLRISEHYQCANLKQVVLKYRIHSQQLTVRKRKEQILCVLAAQASAGLRMAGNPDPLNSVKQITPALLAGMGVSEAMQKNKLAEGYFSLINQMYKAGARAAALEAAEEMFQLCKGKFVERRYISGAHIASAKASWKQGRRWSSVLSVGHAVLARPRVLGRPLKPLLRLLSLYR
ncbi:MAG: glycosyltransferase [Candidatus Acidiferrales bacterium]